MFLAAVLAGDAERLVTGDSDLLVIGAVGNATIVTPAAFVQELD